MSYLDTIESIKQVAIYIRVSTEAQAEKFSLPAQEKLTKELAAKHRWEVVKFYRDEGFSGSWIERRPAFSELLQDASTKRFQAVVVTDSDRLSRPDNLKDLGRIQEVFIKHNIKIVTLSDVTDLADDDQWFLSSLLAIVSAKEKKKLIARMKRGIEAKKEQGFFYGGIPPSGYQWHEGKLVLRDRREIYLGKKKGQKYICYDWKTVKEFFDLYLYSDRSIKSICTQYKIHFHSLAGILDRAWFYGGFVLKTRNREEWAKKTRKVREQLVKGSHPAIISPEEAERVINKRQRVYVAYGKTRNKFPSSGLLQCGICGEAMYVYRSSKKNPERTYYYYVCRTRHGAQRWVAEKRGIELPRCSMKFIRADQVERAVWNGLEKFLTSPETVFEQAGSVDYQVALLERDLEEMERVRLDLARRRSNLMDLYEYGKFDLKELDERVESVKQDESKLEKRREENIRNIEAYAERRLDPEKVFKILSQTEELIRFAEPEHRREIVRLLCRKITVRVDGKVEILATLPAERALRSVSVALGSSPGAEVYQLGLQQDTVVREGDFAGLGYRSAAHKAGIGYCVMRRAERTRGDNRRAV
jgi:site-specific DNA recombinase